MKQKGEPMSIRKYDGLDHKSKLYGIWCNMRHRCLTPTHPLYKNYGARGITVCDEWLDFNNFKSWALANGYKENEDHKTRCSIDRIDNNGNYEPNNCRWATAKEQTNNTRKNVSITYKGETHTLAEWADIKGIKYTSLMNRYYRKWDIKKMLETPTDEYRKRGRKCQ